MAYQPSEDEIALTMQTYSLSRSSAIDELEKARSCPGCKQDWGMSKREQKKHMETCPSKAKKTVSKRVKKNPKQLVQSINALATQDQASIVPTTPDQVTTEDFILDIEVTAEEQENKGRYLQDFSRRVNMFNARKLRPVTALASLDDLLQGPARRSTQFRLQQIPAGYVVQVKSTESDGVQVNSQYTKLLELTAFTLNQAKKITKYGMQPILERLLVSPSELGSDCALWLVPMAVLLSLQSEADFRLQIPEPRLILDPNTREIVIKVQFRGFDQERKQYWTVERQIHVDTASGDHPAPWFPFLDKIDWLQSSSTKDVAEDVADAVKQTPEYELAQSIAAHFFGHIGTLAEGLMAVDAMIVRHASRSSHAQEAFRRLADQGIVDTTIPWCWMSSKSGQVRISLSRDLERYVNYDRVKTIRLPNADIRTALEVHDAMLTELLTGSDIYTAFEAGARIADMLNIEGDDSTGVSLNNQCGSQSRHSHWHTCAGCLKGRPCDFFHSRNLQEMLCNQCLSETREVGWRLEELLERTSKDDTGSAPQLIRSGFQKGFRKGSVGFRLRDYVALELKSKRLGFSAQEQNSELQQTWTNFRDIYQADSDTTYHDVYVKSAVRDEGVERQAVWHGSRYSSFAPSVEQVRILFFKNGVVREHADGNLGCTSFSMNQAMGANVKASFKAIRQLMLAQTKDDQQDAIHFLLQCSLIRCEYSLNNKQSGIGQLESPYLQQLSQAFYSGELPETLYVPNEIAFNPMSDSLEWRADNRPDWKPDNFDTYLQPQIESMAQRYGLADPAMRKYWTINNPATGGHEVPFIFSKSSFVMSWTWFNWYRWCSQRLRLLRRSCDNHSTVRYKDDPVTRKTWSVESFMLTLLHLYMSRVSINLSESRQFNGQEPGAFDSGGFEWLLNIRNPLSLSIAHLQHGEGMKSGYINLDEYPDDQSPQGFVHDNCNISLETLLVNIGRWSTNDPSVLSEFLDQIKGMRLEEDDFLPLAPRAYPSGCRVQIDLKAFTQRLAQSKAVMDKNFSFSKRVQKCARALLALTETQKLHDIEESGTEDDEDDGQDAEGGPTQFLVEHSSTPPRIDPNQPGLIVRRLIPRGANLGRGLATCYVSTAVQLLHKISPLTRFVSEAQMEHIREKLVLESDPGLQYHYHFMNELKSVFTQLELNSISGQKVSSAYTQSFREACNQISKLGMGENSREGDWEDVIADSNEFLGFTLDHLTTITDKSQVQDLHHGPLSEIAGQRRVLSLENPENVSFSAQEAWGTYISYGHDTELNLCYTVHVVTEELCDNTDCSATARTHDFLPFVTLQMTPSLSKEQFIVSIERLQQQFLHQADLPRSGCASCKMCGIGKWTNKRSRIMNAPEILMFSIQRNAGYITDGEQNVLGNRLCDIDTIKLRDWQQELFTETKATKLNTCYQLAGVILHSTEYTHYIAFVREKSDHSGSWVCFDDLDHKPEYQNPFTAKYDAYAETLLVYRKIPLLKIAPITREVMITTNQFSTEEISQQASSDARLSTTSSTILRQAHKPTDTSATASAKPIERIFDTSSSGGSNLSQEPDLPPSRLRGSSGESHKATVTATEAVALQVKDKSLVPTDTGRSHADINAIRHAHILVNNRHAQLTSREQELYQNVQQLSRDREELTSAQAQLTRQTEALLDQETKLKQRIEVHEAAEADLRRRRRELDESKEPSLVRLQHVLEQIIDNDVPDALKIMHQFQLQHFSRLRSKASMQSDVSAGHGSQGSTVLSSMPATISAALEFPTPSAQASIPGVTSTISRQSDRQLQSRPASPALSTSPSKSALRSETGRVLSRPQSVRFQSPNPFESDEEDVTPRAQQHSEISTTVIALDSEEEARMPSSKRPHKTLTPMTSTLSPLKKKSKVEDTRSLTHSDSMQSLRSNIPILTRSDSTAALTTPSLVRSDSQKSMRHLIPRPSTPAQVLHHSDSMSSVIAHTEPQPPVILQTPTLIRSDSHKSLRRPLPNPPMPGQSLHRTDSMRSIVQPTEHQPAVQKRSRVHRFTRIVTPSTLMSKLHGGKSQKQAAIPPPPAPYSVIQRIEDHRIVNGEFQLFVVRAGVEGTWESIGRVTREAPGKVQEYMASRGLAMPAV